MPSDAVQLDLPMLPPLVLRPPWGPRLLQGLILLLASIFHVVTAGWSLITNGSEGVLAGSARMLLRDDSWLPAALGDDHSVGLLTLWLCKVSMKVLGVSELPRGSPSRWPRC